MAVKLGGWGLGLNGDRLRTSRISVIRSAVVRRERLLLVRWGSRRGCCAGAAAAAGSSGCGVMVRAGRVGVFRVPSKFGSSAVPRRRGASGANIPCVQLRWGTVRASARSWCHRASIRGGGAKPLSSGGMWSLDGVSSRCHLVMLV